MFADPFNTARRGRGAGAVRLPDDRGRLDARLPLEEMEYTTLPAVAEKISTRWEPLE